MGFQNEAAGGAATESFDFSTDGIDPNELNSGGRVGKPGFYPVEVEDVARNLETHNDRGEAKSPHLSFTFLVLADQPKLDGKGCRHYHQVMLAGKGGAAINEFVREKTAKFGLEIGILANRSGKLVNAATGNPSTPIEAWETAKGKRFVLELEYDQKKDPEGRKKANGKDLYVTDTDRLRIKRAYQWDDPNVAEFVALVDGAAGEGDDGGVTPDL